MDREKILANCHLLLKAYSQGDLGQTRMPEDSNPGFLDKEQELRLTYFTLPMSLNYQRDSYKLWEAALKTFNDPETQVAFDVQKTAELPVIELREKLMRYKLALQPNKHISIWQTLSTTFVSKWGSVLGLMSACDNDYLKLRQLVQVEHKKEFPYLSGPKIFNYWSFILKQYGKIDLKNYGAIEIAPDTHITQASVKLGIITEKEAVSLTKDQISLRWRELLNGSGIHPIDMHPPLWFWSRNEFMFKL
ncbi:MAG TPA: hypothetical protein VJG90_03480 [Candidatus Nanoarchaeia archaeon]|nr:hypothetical protein [Candidatus Nanoarchaeia archaeon]